MAKKKKDEGALAVEAETAGAVEYFTTESWKNVKTVFKCCRCGTFRDTRDEMVEHVLLHYPKDEQERVFEELIKE